jgi:ABC-type transport system involved in multi-copper enzyme maturation permease subunit
MQRISAIIENTFKEALRQRILILIGVFSAVIIMVSVFLEPFALGEAPKILRDIGLAVPAFFGVLVVIIVGSTLIHKDIEKRTIYTVITKPVRRSEIIIGKFLGLFLLILVLELGMALIQQVTLLLYEGAFDISLFIAFPFILLEIAVLLGILLLFSSFSTPTLSAVMGVLFFVIGHAGPDLKMFADQVKVPLLKYLAYGFYYVLPNLENFNYRLELVYKLPLYSDQIFFSLCYGLVYTIFLVYVAVIVFEGREFK